MAESAPAPLPPDEARRLAAVERYKLGGIGREPAFDHITQFAADLFDVSMSLVSIIGSDMQCFRGACGIDASGTSRDVAFCAFAILGDEVMVVPDATQDARFRNNPMVTGDPFVRFYAGAPLRVSDGQAVGTLCLVDPRPRDFGADERKRLAQLARTVVDLIELRVDRFAAEQHRQQLANERELLKLTVENVSEAVALVDGDLHLTVWNEVFVELFDYPDGLVTEGVNAASLMRITAARGELGPGGPDQIVAGFAASIRANDNARLEIQRRDGRILDIWRKSISGGRFIMTARDVTDERQIQRLKDELVSTVSHELRTPLTALSGAVNLLASGRAGELPVKARHLIGIGQRNADRLMLLVNDLLDMDKLQSGRLAFAFGEHDLGAVLVDAAEQIQPLAEQFGVAIRLELPNRPVMAEIDPGRIVQITTNLLSNACKFSPRGAEVRLALAADESTAVITVADQGRGISPEFQQHLFTRFAQEKSGLGGTGLGLAITKAMVEAHGGTIALDPTTKTGATFRVRLPLAQDDSRVAQAAE